MLCCILCDDFMDGFRLNIGRTLTTDLIIESTYFNVYNRSTSTMKPRPWDGYKLQTENCIWAHKNANKHVARAHGGLLSCCVPPLCKAMECMNRSPAGIRAHAELPLW